MLIVRSAHEELRRWLTEVSDRVRLLRDLLANTCSGTNQTPRMLIIVVTTRPLADLLPRFSSPDPLEYDSRAQFYYAYSSLVLYSFGLENALEVRAEVSRSYSVLIICSEPRWTFRSSCSMSMKLPL